MKLYFVEGADEHLLGIMEFLNIKGKEVYLCRGWGYKFNRETMLNWKNIGLSEFYTNDEEVLDFPGFWNEETQQHDIYFWRHDKWVLLQDLTDKELRQPHCLSKLYRAGAFDNDEVEEEKAYWYESHLGGLFSSDEELSLDELYCETCGDYDIFICYGTKEDAVRTLEEDNA